MTSPYYNTCLDVIIRVEPKQMNNNIIQNITENLMKKYKNKCYQNYGYIDAIYGIEGEIKGGLIKAEDNTASSLHKVRFKCRLCNPIKGSKLVAKITGINNMLIIAETGPIKFIIGNTSINKDNIVYLNTKSAFFPKNSSGEIIDKPIQIGTYVIVKVMNKKIVNQNPGIISVASLDSVARDEEVKKAIEAQYDTGEIIGADDYLERDNKFQEEQAKAEAEAKENDSTSNSGSDSGSDIEQDDESEESEDE